MQGLFARVGSGDPVRVLRLFHNNYTGYCCIHLLCRATYNLSLPRLSANYYGLPTTVQLRAAHESRCSLVGVSRSTAVRYCTVPALNGIITGPFSLPATSLAGGKSHCSRTVLILSQQVLSYQPYTTLFT